MTRALCSHSCFLQTNSISGSKIRVRKGILIGCLGCRLLPHHHKGVSRPERLPLRWAVWNDAGLTVDGDHVGSGLTHRTPETHRKHVEHLLTHLEHPRNYFRLLFIQLNRLCDLPDKTSSPTDCVTSPMRLPHQQTA